MIEFFFPIIEAVARRYQTAIELPSTHNTSQFPTLNGSMVPSVASNTCGGITKVR